MRDSFSAPLKAGAVALFAVGMLLFFLNPPSLSGAGGMAVFVGGGLLLMLATAWAFVAMSGRDSMSDEEFEHLVRRSEELAREPDLRAQATEFDLLVALARKPRQVFTREVLLEQVWGYRHAADTRLVNVHVQRLRAKIEPDPERPEVILTVRGVGYKAGTA